MKTILIILFYSIFKPDKTCGKINPLRDILKFPILFDVTTFLLQLRYLKRVKKIERISNVSDYLNDVIDYNYSITLKKLITRDRRAEIYYQQIRLITKDLSNKKLLIIGPRNVHEIYLAWLYGFKWKNIKAIDLYSTHPNIEIMDMNNLTFPENTFDCVVMANTLPYSENTERTIMQVSSVLKPSGIFSFGGNFALGSDRWRGNKIDGKTVYKFLKKAGMRIFVHNPIERNSSHGVRQTINNFGAQKIDKDVIRHDEFLL